MYRRRSGVRFRWRNWSIVLVMAASALAAGQRGDVATLLSEGDREIAADWCQDAVRAYRDALQAGADFSHDALHSRNLGRCYLRARKPDYAQAAYWLERAVAIQPGDDARLLLARAQTGMGAYDAAAESYRALALAHPQDPDYILGCARALRQAGKHDAALDWLRDRLERAPLMVSVRVEFGRLLAFHRRLPEARRQFELALTSDPQNLGAQVGLAKVTSWEGDQSSALRQYERVLQRSPGLYDAVVGKAFSLLWTGRMEEARSLLREAARRHPEDEDVREALRSMGVQPSDVETQSPQPPAARTPASKMTWRPSSKPPAKKAGLENMRAGVRPAQVADPGERPALLRAFQFVLTHKAAWYSATLGGLAMLAVVLLGAFPRRKNGPARVQILRVILPLHGTAAAPMAQSTTPPKPELQGVTEASGVATTPAPRVVHAEPARPVDAPAPAAPAAPLRGTSVALIGSHQAVVQFESRVLAKVGAEVTAFTSWLSAVESVDASGADLLVLNPVTEDGWTALSMFGWLGAHRPELLGRCLLTISVRDAEAMEFFETHGDIVLFHPFGVNELLRSMIRLKDSSAVPPRPPCDTFSSPARA